MHLHLRSKIRIWGRGRGSWGLEYDGPVRPWSGLASGVWRLASGVRGPGSECKLERARGSKAAEGARAGRRRRGRRRDAFERGGVAGLQDCRIATAAVSGGYEATRNEGRATSEGHRGRQLRCHSYTPSCLTQPHPSLNLTRRLTTPPQTTLFTQRRSRHRTL